ncbi:extended synaptotagmin-1 [Ammospiza caudacuta]|uniref:extended synaptotagmin-1 n=1 Tax=Ammospiza caudacuta TaxID=2857398 RepID=UPI002739EF92|nr:extended synaptotagmin-1 [Ammospiza caudacuta]
MGVASCWQASNGRSVRVCGGACPGPRRSANQRRVRARGAAGAAPRRERNGSAERERSGAEMERRSGLGLAALGALGRRLLWALPAYAAGLLGLGAGAVVLALALYAGWRRRRRARERGMRAAERLHREEEAAVRAAARGELPAWPRAPPGTPGSSHSRTGAVPARGTPRHRTVPGGTPGLCRASRNAPPFLAFPGGAGPHRDPPGSPGPPHPHPSPGVRRRARSPRSAPRYRPGAAPVSFPDVERAEWLNKVRSPCVRESVCPGVRVSACPSVCVSECLCVRESVVCNTSAPVWEDAFRFFLHDPRNQDVDFQVKDDPRQSPLGSLSLPLSRLLLSPSLSLSGPFPLQRSGPGARLHLQMELRVLFPEPPEPGAAAPAQAEPPKSDTEGAPPRPSQAGPDPRAGTERVLRVHLLEAEALIAKDQRLGGLVRGRSDPYAQVRAGGSRFRSRVIKEELNPRWNESYEVIVDDVPGQDVEFELFDKDIDKDDFLGRCKVPLKRVLSSRVVDEWLPLQDVRSGRLHVRLESLEPRPSPELLDRVLHTNALLQPPRGPELSAALLRVYLDRAADLPLRKGSQPPSAFASLAVGDVTFRTKSCPPSPEPVWDEGFSFLIRRPHVETLELQVRSGSGPALASLSLPLAQLLPRAGLSMDGWVPLPGGGQILLRAQLGVLVSRDVEEGAARGAPGGGEQEEEEEEEPRREEDEEDEEDEQRGAGGLRQRPVPADRRPQGPRVLLSLWHHRQQGKLVAIVHGCRDLRASSRDPPDPYVSLVLLPERSKRKTGVQRRTLNPEFNERFEWELPPDEAPRRRLEATVKSSVNFVTREKEALGKLHLELARVDLSEGDPRWYELQDERSLP